MVQTIKSIIGAGGIPTAPVSDIHPTNAICKRLVGTTLALGLLASSVAWAETKDYEFQLLDGNAKKGSGAVISVRLIDKRTGKTVPDAVIIAKRLDMAPEGMPTMAAPLEALPSTEPGTYRFKTSLTMEGGWQLSLGAKVQGETGTVESKLLVKVQK